MPLHDYVCKKCKLVEERLIFNEREESALRCSKCHGKVKKQISAANFEVHGFSADNGYSKKPKEK